MFANTRTRTRIKSNAASMKSPTVSIIVPNYNYARYLDLRIESILDQSFRDFELILLDDASTDNSLEVLEKYKSHPKVSQIAVNTTNTGLPFAQWQKGVALARGKYIWIAEADDLAHPHFLEACVNAMESTPDATVAFAGAEIIDSDGNTTGQSFDIWLPANTRDGAEYKVFDGREYIIHNMYWGSAVYNASGALFRRSAVSDKDFEECTSMRNSGDWLFWTKLIAKGKNIEIYRKLNRFRIHGGNTTSKGKLSGNLEIENMRVMRYMEEHFPIGFYRKTLRHGLLIKRILRSDMCADKKQEMLSRLRSTLGATMWAYRFERIHKLLMPILPGLKTPYNDRI